jgi:hypothetical protein
MVTLAGCEGITGGTISSSTSTAAKGSTPLPGDGDPQIYWDTLKQQVAQGLHHTVAELTALWSRPPGGVPKGGNVPAPTTIADVARQEGLSRAQLTTLELTAIQAATNLLVQQGFLTASQADAQMQEIRSWGVSDLNGYTMYAFANH